MEENYRLLTGKQRQYRHFSEDFKRRKVQEIQLGLSRVADICKQYQVSTTAVYKWLQRYGVTSTPERLIMESKSDTQELLLLKKRIAELEQLVGQKQIQLEFKDKMIDLAEQMYGVDIKKKLSTPRFAGSGNTEKP